MDELTLQQTALDGFEVLWAVWLLTASPVLAMAVVRMCDGMREEGQYWFLLPLVGLPVLPLHAISLLVFDHQRLSLSDHYTQATYGVLAGLVTILVVAVVWIAVGLRAQQSRAT